MFNANEHIENMTNSAISDMQILAKRMLQSLQSSAKRIENSLNHLETLNTRNDCIDILNSISGEYSRSCSQEFIREMKNLIERVKVTQEIQMIYEIERRASEATRD